MNRAFFSLYFVIVVSVVLVGWGADKLWQVYNPEPEVGPYESLFFDIIEADLAGLSLDEAKRQGDTLTRDLDVSIELYSVEELAASSLSQRIAAGGIVTIFDEQGRKSSYKRIGPDGLILRVNLQETHHEQGLFYVALLVVFYLVIAIIIYFWIWPLSRDLRKLQVHTQKVGVALTPQAVELGQGSTVYSLAEAFNKMAERIHELLASHKEMTYAVSHELRTPLARMKFALALAKDSGNVDLMERQLSSISEDVVEMDSLINELLTYAGFEQHTQSLEYKAGDLMALTEHILLSNRSTFNAARIETHIENKLHDQDVLCDWYLLERCLHNVVQNAFKYSEAIVHVTLVCEDGRYIIVIEDDGPGISSEDADRVFHAFVRLRTETQENKSGFGLGLAIVHRIMKWHGGEVAVSQSTLGGAKFELSWPIPPERTSV